MEENIQFRSDFFYDLPAHKEYNKLLTDSVGRNTVMNLLTMTSMLYLMAMIARQENKTLLILTMVLSGYYLLYHLFRHVRSKDGGVVYQQILQDNEDNIPHQIVTLDTEGIRSRNPRTGNDVLDSYDSVRYMMESENLLVVVTDQKMCHILDKRYLSGGSREELIAHLQAKCPKLQKRIKNGRLGRIVSILLLVVAALGLALGSFLMLKGSNRVNGQLSNRMSYTEMAAELKNAGITISQQTITELEAYDAEYALENGDYYEENSSASKVLDLLYWEGCGIYDEQTWEWTPSESGIYWFDLEVWNVSGIYTDFLRGVDALSQDLVFENVTEDYTAVDIEGGQGTVLVAFDYEGKSHQLEAAYNYDWFDLKMIQALGRILAADSKVESLWFAQDGGQGLYLFYGNDAQMNMLQKQSGLDFQSCELAGILS